MKLTKLFSTILKLDANTLHKFLKNYLTGIMGYDNISDVPNKYLYCKGNIPVLLVAHLDTVHIKTPTDIFTDHEKGVIWSPQGIGGDDRAGVYGVLKVLEHCKPHVLFLHDEEIGGIGADYATYHLDPPEVNYMIEFDRKGVGEAVFYQCGNKEFQDFILGFGFNKNYGSFSDISVLSPIWDLASVNLSIGYHNAHTLHEYIVLDQLYDTVFKTIDIINHEKSNMRYDFQEIYRRSVKTIDYYSQLTAEELDLMFGFDITGGNIR